MSETFDNYCNSRQIHSVEVCDPDLTLCALCELKWYKQRCEELEKQIGRMKMRSCANCKIKPTKEPCKDWNYGKPCGRWEEARDE
jgi:hypothetical protein